MERRDEVQRRTVNRCRMFMAILLFSVALLSSGLVHAQSQSLECAAYRDSAKQVIVKLEGVSTPDNSKFLSGSGSGSAIAASRVTRITSQTIITPQPASALPDPVPSFVEPTTPTFRITFSTTLTATTTTIQYKDTNPTTLTADCLQNTTADRDSDGIIDADDPRPFVDTPPVIQVIIPHRPFKIFVENSNFRRDLSSFQSYFQGRFEVFSNEPIEFGFFRPFDQSLRHINNDGTSGTFTHTRTGWRALNAQGRRLPFGIHSGPGAFVDIALLDVGGLFKGRSRTVKGMTLFRPSASALVDKTGNAPLDVYGNEIPVGGLITPLDYKNGQAIAPVPAFKPLECQAINRSGQNKLYLAIDTTKIDSFTEVNRAGFTVDGNTITSSSIAVIDGIGYDFAGAAITLNTTNTARTVRYQHGSYSVDTTCGNITADWDEDGVPNGEDFSSFSDANPFVATRPTVVVEALGPAVVVAETVANITYQASFRLKTDESPYYVFGEARSNLNFDLGEISVPSGTTQIQKVTGIQVETIRAGNTEIEVLIKNIVVPRSRVSEIKGFTLLQNQLTDRRENSLRGLPSRNPPIDINGNPIARGAPFTPLDYNDGQAVAERTIPSALVCATINRSRANKLYVALDTATAEVTTLTFAGFSVAAAGSTEKSVPAESVALVGEVKNDLQRVVLTLEAAVSTTQTVRYRQTTQSAALSTTCPIDIETDWDGDGVPDSEDFSTINDDNPLVDKAPEVVVRAVRPRFRGAEYGLIYIDPDSGDWHFSFEVTASEPLPNLLHRQAYYLAFFIINISDSALSERVMAYYILPQVKAVASKKNTARLDFYIENRDNNQFRELRSGAGYTVGLVHSSLSSSLKDRTGNIATFASGLPFPAMPSSAYFKGSYPQASEVLSNNPLDFALPNRPTLTCARYAKGADKLFIAFSTTETIVATTQRFAVRYTSNDGSETTRNIKPALVSSTSDISVYTLAMPTAPVPGGNDAGRVPVSSFDDTLRVLYLERAGTEATEKYGATCYQDDTIDYDGDRIPDAVDPQPFTDAPPVIEVSVSEPISTIYKRTTNSETETFEIAHQVQFEISLKNEPASEEFFIAAGRALLHISTGNALAGPFMHRLRDIEYYDAEGNRINSGEDGLIVRGKVSLALLDRGGLFKGRSSTVTGLTLARHPDLVDTAGNVPHDINNNPIPLNMPLTPLDYKNGQAVAAVPPAEPLVCTAINRSGQNKLYVAIDTAKIDSFTALNRAGFTVGEDTVTSQSVVPINGIGYSYVGAAITLSAAVNTTQTVRYQHGSYSVDASCVPSNHADWDEDGVPDIEDVSSLSDANPLVATSPTVVVEVLSHAVEVARTGDDIEYQAAFRLTTDEPPYYKFSGAASGNNFDLGEVYFSGTTPQKVNGISVETLRASSTQIEVLVKNIVVASSPTSKIKGFTLLQATGRDSSNRQRELSDRVNAYPRDGGENQRNLPIDINGNPIAHGAPFTPLDYNNEQAVAFYSPLDCAAIDSNGQNKLYLQLNTKQAKITTPTVAGFSVAAVGGVEKPVPAESVALIGEVENDLMRAVITLEAVVSAAQFVHYRHTTQSAVLSAICAVDADDDRDGDQVPDSEDFSAINNDNPFVATSPVVVVRAVRPTTAGGVIPDSDYGFIYGDDDSDWYLSFEVTASEPLPNLLNQDSYYLAFVNESKLREMIGFKPTAAIAVVGKRHTARLDFFIPTSAAVARDGIGYTVGLQSVTRTTGTVSFAALVDRSGNVAQLNHGIPLLSGNRTTAAESSAPTTVSEAYRKNISAFARRGSPSLRVRLKVFLEGALQ